MIHIRLAKPSDWQTMQRLHAEQNASQGTAYALPKLFGPAGEFASNIALAFVVERDGAVVSSFYFEMVPEVCFAGCDPQATAFARREIDRIAFGLRNMGYTGINCYPPESLVEHIAPPLEKAGFERVKGLTHFFKDLRKTEGEI